MKLNVKPPATYTHEGARASTVSPVEELRRAVMACMLWEDQFYESGQSIGDRIKALVPQCKPDAVAEIAIHARTAGNLRHAPLLLARELARHPAKPGAVIGDTIAAVIQRADELAEFVAIYWREKRQPLSAQAKRGLAMAFAKFGEYALAKYNRDGAVKLRDVLFLCHAKPKDDAQAALWKRLVAGELAAPDTWEVALSAGANKRETFERLMTEKKLGALAFLRNLRNMREAGVPREAVAAYGAALDISRVLPFRFIAAARAVPEWDDAIEPMLMASAGQRPKLPGRTVVLVDVSGSMDDKLSAKSDMRRLDAAYGVAICAREMCEQVAVLTFSNALAVIPPRRGFALRDAMHSSQQHGGTLLGAALKAIGTDYDRIIVITDEQSHDAVPPPSGKGYIINVASYQRGVGYGPWMHINGFSESVIDYIAAAEREQR